MKLIMTTYTHKSNLGGMTTFLPRQKRNKLFMTELCQKDHRKNVCSPSKKTFLLRCEI